MGTNCSYHPSVSTKNKCTNSIGDTYQVPNFCTLYGPAGTPYRKEACEALSDGEWRFIRQEKSCEYNSCDNRTDFGSGCCNGCCGIAGGGATCERITFKGDPLLCCLRDQVCTPTDEQLCFEDSSERKTCSYETRNQASFECRNRTMGYCTGIRDDGTKEPFEVWSQRWLGTVSLKDSNGDLQYFDRPCYRNVYRNLYDGTSLACEGKPSFIPPSSGGFIYAQELVSNMLQRYIEDGGRLDASESTEGNTQLNGMILSICKNNSGLCARALSNYCTNVTSETLIRSSAVLPWCGCYMPAEQYSKYTDLYQLSRECTPMCNRKDVIHLPSDDGISELTCKQSSCIIDDVSIGITRSTIGSSGQGITFDQLCSACESGACTCIITNATYDIIDSTTGNISISQKCGSDAICYKEVTDPEGKKQTIRVPCQSTNYNPYSDVQKQDEANRVVAMWWRNLKILAILFCVFVVLAVLWLIVRPASPPISIPKK